MGASQSMDAETAAVAELVSEVTPSHADWRWVSSLLQSRSSPKHLRHYGYSLNVLRLFRIQPGEIVQQYEKEARKLGKPAVLFHGTTPASAQRVILEGFQLPERSGMFGRGIYFAKDALKSANYARKARRPSTVTLRAEEIEGSSSSLLGDVWSGVSKLFRPSSSSAASVGDQVRHLLICDVYLGHQRCLRSARPRFDPDRGLRRNRLLRFLGAKPYESIRAPGGQLGAVRVSEYVIYKEHQAIPRFLVEFDQRPYPPMPPERGRA